MGNRPVSEAAGSCDDDDVAAKSSTQKEEEEKQLAEQFHYEKNVCALEYWAPIKLLAEGSISDIHLCCRREQRIRVRYKEE